MGVKTTNSFTLERQKKICTDALIPLMQAGENATLIFVPQGGRRRWVISLAENSDQLGFKKLGKYLMLHIDPNELTHETPNGYFSLMKAKIQEKTQLATQSPSGQSYPALKKMVAEIANQDYHLIFILRKFEAVEFPITFFNNLTSLWEVDKTKVHFIIATCHDVPRRLKKYGTFKEAIAQNLIYFPLLSDNEQEAVIKVLSQTYGYKISQKPTILKKLSGGNASLIKACLRILAKHKDLQNEQKITDLIFNQYEVGLILEEIWKHLEDDEQNVFRALANHLPLKTEETPERLLKLGLIKGDKELKPFSPLFTLFVRNKGRGQNKLTLNQETGQVLANSLPIKEKLTLQEYHLLAAFLEKPGFVYSRDEIADILWGKDADDKYSDWAIDQITSRLRKTLSRLGIPPSTLQTIRKRGYRWLEGTV